MEPVTLYAVEDEIHLFGLYNAYVGNLTTWDGQIIARFKVKSQWNQCNGYETFTMRSIQATINGTTYHGRYGSDWSQAVTLRPYRNA